MCKSVPQGVFSTPIYKVILFTRDKFYKSEISQDSCSKKKTKQNIEAKFVQDCSESSQNFQIFNVDNCREANLNRLQLGLPEILRFGWTVETIAIRKSIRCPKSCEKLIENFITAL